MKPLFIAMLCLLPTLVMGAEMTGRINLPQGEPQTTFAVGPGLVAGSGNALMAVTVSTTFRAIEEIPMYAGLELGFRSDLAQSGMHGYGLMQYYFSEFPSQTMRPYLGAAAGWSLMRELTSFDLYLTPGFKLGIEKELVFAIEARVGLSDASLKLWPHFLALWQI